MASSPTPSLESLPGAGTISLSSFGEQTDYLSSDSPLTLSGSSPPISSTDSTAILNDDFINNSLTSTSSGCILTTTLSTSPQGNNFENNHHNNTNNYSGGLIGINGGLNNCIDTIYPRCTGCKNKQSDAVAKCIDCINYLCSQCVTAHQRMHCFDGHNVYRINELHQLQQNNQYQVIGSGMVNGNNINSKMLNNFDTNTSSLTTSSTTSSCNNRLTAKDDQISNLIMNNLLNNDQMQSSISPPISSTGRIISPPPSQQQQQQPPTSSAVSTTSSIISPIITNNKMNNINSVSTVNNIGPIGSNSYFCQRHKNELLKFYCRTCSQSVCKECIIQDHPHGLHDCEHLQEPIPQHIENLLELINNCKLKVNDMRLIIKNYEHNNGRIQIQYHKAQNEINDTYQFYKSMIDERKDELLKDLENILNTKNMYHSVLLTKSQEQINKILQTCEFAEKMMRRAGLAETIMLKKLMETKLQSFIPFIQELQSSFELDFISNYQAIQVGVRNTYGYIRSETPAKQPPIARPTSTTLTHSTLQTNNLNNINNTNNNNNNLSNHINNTNTNYNNILTNGSSPSSSSTGSLNNQLINGCGVGNGSGNGCHSSSSSSSIIIERPFSNGHTQQQQQQQQQHNRSSPFDSNIITKRFNNVSLGPFINDINIHNVNPYEKWSNGGIDNNIFNHLPDQYTNNQMIQSQDTINELSSKLIGSQQSSASSNISSSIIAPNNTTIFPPKSQIKRQKMIYHCKFGEFGVMEGQFTEPSGVAVNAQNDIIVADTNNHRIQIFDKEGRFKFQFGECGKRDGQLLYPNRVAVVRTSGDIIVTERSPTHQIQIYNQYGQFVRKFGANILQHPRGVTVDNKGRIIVVECKVMRVIIFDQSGNVIHKFGCSKHLEFPNGVVVNDKQEIFISDNRAHCVKVFSYDGIFLRQIGGEGITNYPIGVGINIAGEILIADNHNNFNLTIFTQDGQLVSALESKVKHAQCFDVALMDDGSVVLASKDYRLYIYRYIQVPQI